MNKEDALRHIERLVPGSLSSRNRQILSAAWDGKEYEEIADEISCSTAHAKHLGSQLWSLLSSSLGRSITKSTFRGIFEQMLQPIPVLGDQPPLTVSFYGRAEELATLKTQTDQNHVVALIGPPGIGKSTLAAKLVQTSSATRWDQALWKFLTPNMQLNTLIESLLAQLQVKPSSKPRDPISLLLESLAAQRYLIVLDAAEVVRENPEYETFLRQIVSTSHQSCIVLTSEEPLEIIEIWQFSGLAANTLYLGALDTKSAKRILRDSGLGDEHYWQHLVDHYGRNPLVLKLVANGILDLFGGQVEAVMENVSVVFTDDLEFIIDRQFCKLGTNERRVILALAKANVPLTFPDLIRQPTLDGFASSDLTQVLNFLNKRSIIEILKEKNQLPTYKLNSIVKKHAMNTFNTEAVDSLPIGA